MTQLTFLRASSVVQVPGILNLLLKIASSKLENEIPLLAWSIIKLLPFDLYGTKRIQICKILDSDLSDAKLTSINWNDLFETANPLQFAYWLQVFKAIIFNRVSFVEFVLKLDMHMCWNYVNRIRILYRLARVQ